MLASNLFAHYRFHLNIMNNSKILVTGATGQLAHYIVSRLAPTNTVHTMARFGAAGSVEKLEALGAHCIVADYASDDLSALDDEAPWFKFPMITIGEATPFIGDDTMTDRKAPALTTQGRAMAERHVLAMRHKAAGELQHREDPPKPAEGDPAPAPADGDVNGDGQTTLAESPGAGQAVDA